MQAWVSGAAPVAPRADRQSPRARRRQGPNAHSAARNAGSVLRILITHQVDTFVSACAALARRVFICLSQG